MDGFHPWYAKESTTHIQNLVRKPIQAKKGCSTDNLSPLSRVGEITSDSYNHGGMGFSAVSKCNPNFSLHRSISKMIIKLMISVLKGAITSKLFFF